KGGNAGIGLSLALEIANHLVDSQLERDLTAAGPVSFTADGASANINDAKASSAGADQKKDGSAGSTDTSNKDVNGKADANLDAAKGNDSSGKTSTTTTPKAKSGEGGGTTVTVAAAVPIGMVTANAISAIANGLTVTNPTGA